jgi:hypothetical protein
MKTQAIYDLREVTGFVSGSDLHDIFDEALGTPVPSGNDELPPSFPLPWEAEMTVGQYFSQKGTLSFWLAGMSDRAVSATRAWIAANPGMKMLDAATPLREIAENS